MQRARVVAALLMLPACKDVPRPISVAPCPITECPVTTLVVTGHVRASAVPIVGATVHVMAYRDSCGGVPIALLPAPADAVSDSSGVYVAREEVTQSAPSGCVRVAYSNALFTDASGVALHAPPNFPPDTVRVDVTGP